jgi:hypothetical protein
VLITYRSVPFAVANARLALAGSWEEAGAGGFQAESALRVDVHERALQVSQRNGVVEGEERGRTYVWRAPQLGFSFKLRWEAVGRGRCPSQKGSGAEAVCLECSLMTNVRLADVVP